MPQGDFASAVCGTWVGGGCGPQVCVQLAAAGAPLTAVQLLVLCKDVLGSRAVADQETAATVLKVVLQTSSENHQLVPVGVACGVLSADKWPLSGQGHNLPSHQPDRFDRELQQDAVVGSSAREQPWPCPGPHVQRQGVVTSVHSVFARGLTI